MSHLARRLSRRPIRTAVLATFAAVAAVAAATALAPGVIGAQATAEQTASVQAGAAPPAAAQPDVCYRFAFGQWDPALDLRAAGHPVPFPVLQPPRAPGGRDWASAVASGRDTVLILYPEWWPPGVVIRFPPGARAAADTVRGRATALVADGRLPRPEAEIRTWQVPCGSTPTDRD